MDGTMRRMSLRQHPIQRPELSKGHPTSVGVPGLYYKTHIQD